MLLGDGAEVRETPGRGRGVFSRRTIRAGEVVLEERPLALYRQCGAHACARCLRDLGPTGGVPLPWADPALGARACSRACLGASAADPLGLTPAACTVLARCAPAELGPEAGGGCELLARLAAGLGLAQGANGGAPAASLAGDPEAQAAARSAAASAPAATVVPAVLQSLTALTPGHPRPLSEPLREAARRAALVASALGLPLGQADAERILQIDEANAYGIEGKWSGKIHASGDEEEEEEEEPRVVLGGALFARASMFNHECLPNLARVDGFGADGPLDGGVVDEARGTGVTTRGMAARAAGARAGAVAPSAPDPYSQRAWVRLVALHDIPANEELTISYFPLGWPLEERRERCKELYGFACACPRCVAEERMEAEERGEQPPAAPAAGPAVDWPYIAMFLLRFACPTCGGTLVPAGEGRSVCNQCGGVRTDSEFQKELEELQDA